MRLEYLDDVDGKDLLELFNVPFDKEQWINFWENYSQSDTLVIYCAWIHSKEIDRDIIVGTVSLLVQNKPHSFNPTVYIEDLIVAPHFRRLGLGKEILSKVIEECKTYFPSKIKVSCEEDYDKFFSDFGFNKTNINMELSL